MEVGRFILDNVMAPGLGKDLELIEQPTLKAGHKAAVEEEAQTNRSARKGDSILDLSGPRLLEGAHSILTHHRLLGQINLADKPLYLSIICKLLLLLFAFCVILKQFVIPILREKVLDVTYELNPIFLLMGVMSALILSVSFTVNFYQNLFNLSPLFKILATPKLCFINRATQDVGGIEATRWMLTFMVYHCVLVRLQRHPSLADFFDNFSLLELVAEVYAVSLFFFSIMGLSQLDYYIRFSFSAWLLALRCNLQNRRPRLAYVRQQMIQRSSRSSQGLASLKGCARRDEQVDEAELMRQFEERYVFVDLKEVQKQLNSMDDHLEIWRSCQMASMVCISLIAFFLSGLLFMISYSTITKENETMHGVVWSFIGFDFAVLVASAYIGDSFIGYALSCFVQTVEDEYFLQQDASSAVVLLDGRACRSAPSAAAALKATRSEYQEDEEDELKVGMLRLGQSGDLELEPRRARDANRNTLEPRKQTKATDRLLIGKEDVMFCRELLHQFHDHLSTPWSKLSFRRHFNMMATFATLIAAQIIFDSDMSHG